ncbi:radical SAM protein [Methanopyrus kandleri]|uniref:Predicted Fe-S oxidoreductase n=2 Tax=Methanopyrus kandleri TaxID=2320 RepID=Q8TYL9_METKA|nr:radical SAM protein [Methanopyrus kandleri]AAM01494.1 Predicted Fe-S oxidoreductase [Methanopyrus kandleri AV19]HII70580.1 radical SAM protein [Methanopyrus kandleri]
MLEWRPEPGYDPLETAERVRGWVCEGRRRKYYRFRETRFYGGCATADAVGCNLDCAYCYVNYPRRHPWDRRWKFHRPIDVVERLKNMGGDVVRVSGCEPTLCKEHILELIELCGRELPDRKFVLETNGTILGADRSFVRELGNHEHVHVRVCLKGYDPQSFARITNANPDGFDLQLRCLRYLFKEGISFHPAIPRLFRPEDIDKLAGVLSDIGVPPSSLEVEPIRVYDHVRRELRRRGLTVVR